MNETNNLFEVATRYDYQFEFRGLRTIQELWKFDENTMDVIYRGLVRDLKELTEDSLLTKNTDEIKTIKNKIAIIEHIVNVKRAEDAVKSSAKEKADLKADILKLMKEREQSELKEMSDEELMALYNSLD